MRLCERDYFDNNVCKLLKGVIFVVLTLTVVSSLISYALVLCKEKTLHNLHAQTFTTQMENIDISNDVEFTKSLYNVTDKAKSISYLHKPDKIIEIDLEKDNLNVNIDKVSKFTAERIIIGY